MRIYNIIEKKRDNKELSKEEINYFIEGYTNGEIKDYQASALLMAIFINGMNDTETAYLTDAMANSGDILDLSDINGITADKHSTGGVGDKTSLIVAPICASAGIKIAKMSGRGLGHTGGTIDKLESINGFNVSLSIEKFKEQVNSIGMAIISQTGNLAPADKKLYALRDVTATVDSIPLISSSIMSKKIAAGAKNIVLDVKCGSGAFMKNFDDAAALAQSMVNIGKKCNRNTVAEITNMDIPLGNCIGNSLEIKEVIDILNNKGDEKLKELCLSLSSNIISISLNITYEEALKKASQLLENRSAFNKFKEFVKAQNGDIRQIEHTDLLPVSKHSLQVISSFDGYIHNMNSKIIGECSVILGAGRENISDSIDYGAGILLNKKTGDKVSSGEILATLYTNKKEILTSAEKLFLSSLNISKEKPVMENLIYKIIK